MSKKKNESILASELPTHSTFTSKAPVTKELTVVQKLVAANRKKMIKPLRRRKTIEVHEDLSAIPIEIGGDIWIPDQETVWTQVEIMAHEGMILTVNGIRGESKVDLRELGDVYKVNPRTAMDMTALYYIHEAGILDNLRLRANVKDMHPYTFMANVLIATNPLIFLVEPKIENYVTTQMGEMPPHPYAIAEVAFQQMALRTPSQSQSIVISGESGAGKTETSKIVLRYLTSREHACVSLQDESTWDGTGSELDQRLLDTNPILEAFGNAKTLRNHNSSRFGKFMKLQFSTQQHTLVGASIETYLLEKSRLVYQIPGERNFHIFYFLLSGDEKLRDEFCLTTADDFHYLNQSGCTADVHIDDDILYDDVVTALSSIGIPEEEQHDVFEILAALLHLGNVSLENQETSEGDSATVTHEAGLDFTSQLLGVSLEDFKMIICKREITTRGETFTIPRNAKEGTYVRDALAKSIYQHLFSWIVHKINVSLGHDTTSNLPFIGVLDIFGFESFKRNDFEQLLINYANEALQATFNRQVFITEQELYDKEGIEVGLIQWPDNRQCIELISEKPNGLLVLLDAEAQLPKPSDEKWNATMHKKHGTNPHFLPPHAKDKKFVFIVKHFATAVEYTVGNFIDKNNDTIPKDLYTFVMSSTSPLIKEMFLRSDEASAAVKSKKMSVSGKFSVQMNALVQTLDDTRCNFIRCVKPNADMQYGVFDNGYVIDQLRSTGMLATCELLKVGLPTRVSYAEICAIYKPVLPPTVTPLFAPYNDRTFTEAVLWAFRVDDEAYRLGRTKVFFKTGKIALLDALLKVDMKKMGPFVVARLRKWLARRRWRYAAAKVMGQKGFLWLLNRIRFRKQSILKIQSIGRMYNVRKQFMVTRTAHRETIRRKQRAQKHWKKAIAFVRTSTAWSAVLQKVRTVREEERLRVEALHLKKQKAATSLQKLMRGSLARKRVSFLRNAAALREQLLREEEAAAAELSIRMRGKWRVAVYAIIAQRQFVARFHDIHQAYVVAEEARQRTLNEEERARLAALAAVRLAEEQAVEAERRVRQQALDDEESARMEAVAAKRIAEEEAMEAQRRAEEEALAAQRLAEGEALDFQRRADETLAAQQLSEEMARQAAETARQAAEEDESTRQEQMQREAVAAVRIQSAFRGFLGRQEAKRHFAYVTAAAAAVAAALAADEAVQAADAAAAASLAEAAASQEPILYDAFASAVGDANSLEMGEASTLGIALMGVSEASLGEPDLSWMTEEAKVEGEVSTFTKAEELAQAGRDLFGEGADAPPQPMMEAEEENMINPVERIQEFPVGPPIPYKGGIFTCTMLGHRKQQDRNWGDEYTEYVLRCTWGRDVLDQSKTAWLVGGRYNDFNALHQELKTAASGKRGKRAPWFPRFPRRYPFKSMIGKNQDETFIHKREKELNRYMTQVLTQMPDALLNIHMDRFMNLSLRTQDICEQEAYMEAKKRWDEEEREALANAADAAPLNTEELKEVEQLVHQLIEKLIGCSSDVSRDTQLQEMIHAVKVLQPRVTASSQIGAGVDMELVPLAMQLQDDMQDAFNTYNDTLLAIRLGST